jgi:hypothetical protein
VPADPAGCCARQDFGRNLRPHAWAQLLHHRLRDRQGVRAGRRHQHPRLVRNPGWHLLFGQDPVLAEAARRKIYDMLVAEKMLVQAFR